MNANFRPAGDPAATFQFGEFTFDCGSRLLTRSGVKRHLSLKAQQLLQLLLVARPRALSREELYDALWPSTFVCETNLASIINEVRRALGDDARASNYIRTVHGFGYAFCGEVVSVVAMNFVAATLHCEEQRHPLYEGENLVGRAPDCRVMITANTISRRHALITIYDGSFSIRDLDSKNGTFVDGQIIGRLPDAPRAARVRLHSRVDQLPNDFVDRFANAEHPRIETPGGREDVECVTKNAPCCDFVRTSLRAEAICECHRSAGRQAQLDPVWRDREKIRFVSNSHPATCFRLLR